MRPGLPTWHHPSERLLTFRQWHFCSSVRFTVTGIVRKSHPRSLSGNPPAVLPAITQAVGSVSPAYHNRPKTAIPHSGILPKSALRPPVSACAEEECPARLIAAGGIVGQTPLPAAAHPAFPIAANPANVRRPGRIRPFHSPEASAARRTDSAASAGIPVISFLRI